MSQRPRFLSRLGVADVVTAGNAALGTLAALAATYDPEVAARLILLAAVADGLDGVLARKYGGTPVGPHLDSLADVASFGVAPAVLVAVVATGQWTWSASPALFAASALVPALYVAMAVVRLGVYNVEDEGEKTTHGVQTTLAATVVAAGTLAGMGSPTLLLGLAAILAPLMVTPVQYPDLHWRDALVMGVVQAGAILLPDRPGEVFAFALLFLALGYMTLGPRYYWRDVSGDGGAEDVVDGEAGA
ncbi:protein sorting system archaetidylserine synthase [Halorarum halophilum]|uniref:Protein sorting system archaetidylserine synthase n=1 Tax=Halorarum halophilum TaxID=2743090 RepID=A0A7D5GAE9_9EURY|nr:protein sorting system archaetidylserine synthase [Halobaculum halophilum]QLG26526.1 protein sorting system archaetidylserine synthase [Halobaculum halophilum]